MNRSVAASKTAPAVGAAARAGPSKSGCCGSKVAAKAVSHAVAAPRAETLTASACVSSKKKSQCVNKDCPCGIDCQCGANCMCGKP